jgi:hypothetical protein
MLPVGMSFCEWLGHQHTVDELFLQNILWIDKACFMCEGVLNVHNSNLSPQVNTHTIREHVHQVHFGVNVWALTINDVAIDFYILPDRLTGQQFDFLETVLSGLLEDVLQAVRQRLWFQYDEVPAH